MVTQDEIVAALPCYLKSHSQGEYVFDHGWADAYERAGGTLLSETAVFGAVHAGQRALAFWFPTASVHGDGQRAGARRRAEDVDRPARRLLGACDLRQRAKTFRRSAKPASCTGPISNSISPMTAMPISTHSWRHFPRASERTSARNAQTARTEGIEIEWLTGRDITESAMDAFYDLLRGYRQPQVGPPLSEPGHSIR
jgi:hypothetical protein